MTVDAKMRFGADFTQADGAVDGFQRRVSAAVGGVQPRVEKLATAVSGVGSALGGVGSRAGAAFGAVSNLAAAFMTGGPLILGITAATTAGAALYSHFEQAAKQAEELKKKSAEAAEELRKGLVAAAEALSKELDDARERLTLFGIEGQERNVARVALRMGAGLVEGETLREERARLQREERRALIESQGTSRAREAEREAAERSLAATREALDIVRQKIEANRVEVAQLEEKFELENELLRLEQRRERGRALRRRATRLRRPQDSLSFDVPDSQEFRLAQDATEVRLELERRAAEERQALADASLKQMVDALKEESDRKKAALAEEVRQKKAAEAEKLAAVKAAEAEAEAFRNRKAQESADFFLDVTSQAFSLSLDVLEAGLTGQTQGIAAMVATFVKGIGTQMVGIGIRQISEGAGYLISSGGTDPRGYGLVALGATVSAAGAAMAVTGTVAGAGIKNIQSSAGGGGGGAGVRASSSAGRRAGSQRGEGQGDGTMSITFMGGTFLDSPTDTARHLARTQMRARRTLFVPGGP